MNTGQYSLLLLYIMVFEISFEITDCNLRFVVTISIHMGAMKVRRKVRRGNSFSSEKSSETTAISSGTHPQKFLNKPSSKNEHGNIHTIGIKRDFFSSYINS